MSIVRTPWDYEREEPEDTNYASDEVRRYKKLELRFNEALSEIKGLKEELKEARKEIRRNESIITNMRKLNSIFRPK